MMTTTSPSGPRVLAQLLAGLPPGDLVVSDLGDPWNALALAVLAANGAGREGAFEAALARHSDADTIRRQVFSCDPARTATATRPLRTIRDLLSADFPPLHWLVEGIIPEDSLAILGGRKKLGKTWLAMQIALAVGSGAACLGRATTPGNVMYACLEDGERRFQRRLIAQHAGGNERVYTVFSLENLDQGGLAALSDYIDTYQPTLVILDTLAAMKSARIDENSAGDMGDLANKLRQLAQRKRCSILVVAHHGKAARADTGHDIRGSSAVPAAADVNLALYKTPSGYVLAGEGRDFEDFELRIEFDRAQSFAWQLVGDARQVAKQEADEAVINGLTMLGEADAGTLATCVGKDRTTVFPVLKRLTQAGLISKDMRKDDATGQNKVYFRLAVA